MVIDLVVDQTCDLKLHHDELIKELLHHMCEALAGLNFHQLENGKVIEAIVIAVKQGRVEFVTEILKAFPEIRNIFKIGRAHV